MCINIWRRGDLKKVTNTHAYKDTMIYQRWKLCMEMLKFAVMFVLAFCEAVSIVMEQQSSSSLISINAQSLYIGILP